MHQRVLITDRLVKSIRRNLNVHLRIITGSTNWLHDGCYKSVLYQILYPSVSKERINFGKYTFREWHVTPVHDSFNALLIEFFVMVSGRKVFWGGWNKKPVQGPFIVLLILILLFLFFFWKQLFWGRHKKPVQDPWDLPPLFPNYLLSVLSPPPQCCY